MYTRLVEWLEGEGNLPAERASRIESAEYSLR